MGKVDEYRQVLRELKEWGSGTALERRAAVAALCEPRLLTQAESETLFQRLLESDDPDIRWIARENLRKKRLERLDRDWVEGALLGRQRP